MKTFICGSVVRLLYVVVLLGIVGCDGGGGADETPDFYSGPTFSIAGTWRVTDASDPETRFLMEIELTGPVGRTVEGTFYIEGESARFQVEGFFHLQPWPDAEFRVYDGEDHLFTLSADTITAAAMSGTYSTGRYWSAVKL